MCIGKKAFTPAVIGCIQINKSIEYVTCGFNLCTNKKRLFPQNAVQNVQPLMYLEPKLQKNNNETLQAKVPFISITKKYILCIYF